MKEKLGATPQGRVFLAVIDAAGGPSELAKALGLTRQGIDNWIYLSGCPSRQGAIAIEEAFDGITKESLRPDVTDWENYKRRESGELLSSLESTDKGMGLLAVLARVKNSKKALATLLGIKSPRMIQNWIVRGYVPKHQVHRILALPEFEGLTAEIIRPDLHKLDY